MTPSLRHAIKKQLIKELKKADFQTVAQIARDLARPLPSRVVFMEPIYK